jgi:hypothetical protein
MSGHSTKSATADNPWGCWAIIPAIEHRPGTAIPQNKVRHRSHRVVDGAFKARRSSLWRISTPWLEHRANELLTNVRKTHAQGVILRQGAMHHQGVGLGLEWAVGMSSRKGCQQCNEGMGERGRGCLELWEEEMPLLGMVSREKMLISIIMHESDAYTLRLPFKYISSACAFSLSDRA